MSSQQDFSKASIKTATNLRAIAQSLHTQELSHLSLPQLEAVVDLVARMVPAGNVPGMILNGLARLPGRKPPRTTITRDLGLLFKGVEQTLDRAVYGAFFAGPAAVLWGYQNLLKLAGKDLDASFPEGTWQFYVEYALREDTARHANETHGFASILAQHNLQLSEVDRITAWAITAIQCLHQYPALLANEWYERSATALLRECTSAEPNAAAYAQIYQSWEAQRPYGRGSDARSDQAYAAYRRAAFERFIEPIVQTLAPAIQQTWRARLSTLAQTDLPAYQRQMSILAYLEPSAHGETRVPLSLREASIGLVYRGRYLLLPLCTPGTEQPTTVAAVRSQIAALVHQPPAAATPLAALARLKRGALASLRPKLNPQFVAELDRLRCAPIILNCDQRPAELPLAMLRQTERGVGDHALTLFDTGRTTVFDQSHIFFDGAWGVALAEIMTNEALAWAVYLAGLPPIQPAGAAPEACSFELGPAERELIAQAPQVAPEASAETSAVQIKTMLAVRKAFKQRSDLLQLTVNDLLVLYRAIHALTYQPTAALVAELETMARAANTRPAALAALEAINSIGDRSPAILIPVDASQHLPRERLYPLSFEVPLHELDFLGLHGRTVQALASYQALQDAATFATFNELRRSYLATLAGFGAVLSRAKDLAISGQSGSVGAIKLLAHLPAPFQRLLDSLPGRFDVLNDIIKGREVFSNVGAVARTSTLTRFITAKDDNEKKTLAWGVITDARGVLQLTLRDFRPHVALLAAVGQQALATRITEEYLAAYAQGLNQWMHDLQQITQAALASSEKVNPVHGQ